MIRPRLETPSLLNPVGAELGVLVWTLAEPTTALTSAAVGGGFSEPKWALNIRVAVDYSRTDLAVHAAEVAEALDLDGPGIGLFTATKISRWERGTDAGVTVDATSGVTKPTWAADPDGGWTPWEPGTINIVAHLPVVLEPGAAVNAVMTITEAKTQALGDLDIPGTGTASDAVSIFWPTHAKQRALFAGPRSQWGAPLARAAYDAVIKSARPDRVADGP